MTDTKLVKYSHWSEERMIQGLNEKDLKIKEQEDYIGQYIGDFNKPWNYKQ
jgi:hypothetical protein